MTDPIIAAFALPRHLAAKADPVLITGDQMHFAAVTRSLERTLTDLSDRLDAARRAPGVGGEAALQRDQEIHRLTGRLRTLRRFGLDLCLGRIVRADGSEPVYIGRLGLTDGDGRRLMVDWRSPAAEPFFAATHAEPRGLASRRRYRWTDGRITDYWDEVFTPDGLAGTAALDDQSAFIASLGAARSARMRDVLGTIAADQDAIIRAGSAGALVIDGGPGTGKTVVALHRAAYLLYSDPRLREHRGGVLVVGPHQPYLDYVGDVLPSLGEEGARTCTLRDLLPEGAQAEPEPQPDVAHLKSSLALVRSIETAVRMYEEPPDTPMTVETDWDEVRLTADDWAEAFESPDPGTPHNDARDQVWQHLLTIAVDKHDDEIDPELVRASLARNRDLATAFARAWPLLDAADLVGDLWSVPAYLRMCAPWLSRDEIRALQRDAPRAWTVSDLPLLDAARRRLGDPDAAHRTRGRRVAFAAQPVQMSDVISHLIESDDSELQVMSMLRGQDLRDALADTDSVDSPADPLAGPFAHVIVDEAQELTDAEWQMLLQRCPSGSLTIVGDRAQARHGFIESWQQRLERVGLEHVALMPLTINYRTPAEIMVEAAPVIRAALPDANVPESVRASGIPVVHAREADLASVLDGWLQRGPDGVACVVGTGEPAVRLTGSPRIRWLTPELAKGLEFDLVVLVDPDGFGDGIEGAVDRYVAMTRSTRELVVLERPAAPG